MEKIGYGKWAVWMAMILFLPVLTVDVIAQTGFLSIDCGGKMNYNDKNDIAWVIDANYIDVGQTADLGNAFQQDYRFYLDNLRFFPKPLTKSCYQLPIAPNVPYLLRLWFAAGNYNGFTQRFAFAIETLDMLAIENVIITYPNATYHEEILVSSGRVLYICLIRTSENDDPFINAIELRTLQDGMYEQAKPGTMLHSVSRTDVGGQSTVRHLQNNNLSGAVLEWLSELKNLKELFIENNNFSGVIPAQLPDRPSIKLKYSENPYLCMHMHSGKCIQEIQESTNNSRKGKVSVVLPITISGGLIITLGLVGIAVYWKKVGTKQSSNEDLPTIMVPDRRTSPAFTLEEIMASTQNFSVKIGQGGFGSVFFGTLQEGKDIAVKVLSSFSQQGVYQFQNEIDLLSRVYHKNLESLLGYCNESRELMLIYEHMPGGSLRDHLYGPKAGMSELNWKTRVNIALDAALGLEYLHMGCTPKIIHRDVKTANILLNSNMNGKLADFGLSKLTIDGDASQVNTVVKGTIGYVDPEYFRSQMLTEKRDIYSFGVVLLEIICGRPPINPNLTEEEPNLVQWATPYMEKLDEDPTEIAKIVDKRLGEKFDMKSIIGVAKLTRLNHPLDPARGR